MVAAAIVLVYESRGQTIRGDELGYAARLGTKPFSEAIFNSSPNKYFLPVPLALYDAMFNVFGLAARRPVPDRGHSAACCSAVACSSPSSAAASAT